MLCIIIGYFGILKYFFININNSCYSYKEKIVKIRRNNHANSFAYLLKLQRLGSDVKYFQIFLLFFLQLPSIIRNFVPFIAIQISIYWFFWSTLMHTIVNKSCLVPAIFRLVYLLERHFCFTQSTYHLQFATFKNVCKILHFWIF